MLEFSVIFTIVSEMLAIILCMHIFFEYKLKCNIQLVILLIVNCSIMYAVRAGRLSKTFLLLSYLFMWLYCKIWFQKSIKVTTLKFFYSVALCSVMEAILLMPNAILQRFINSHTLFLVDSLLMLIMILLLGKRMSKQVKILDYNDEKTGMLIWFYILAEVLLIIDYNISSTQLRMSMLILAISIFVGYVYISRLLQTKNDLDKHRRELEMSRNYARQYDELLKMVRYRQHDYKNQMSAIYGMHRTAKSYEALVQMQREYGKLLLENSRYDAILTGCSNPTLAGYLYNCFLECEKQGIVVEYDILVDDVDELMTIHELVEVIGILITNAREYLLEKECHEPIRVFLRGCNNFLELEVLNCAKYFSSLQIERLFLPAVSTKGENRGIGLCRLKEIAEKNTLDICVTNREIDNQNYLCFHIELAKL